MSAVETEISLQGEADRIRQMYAERDRDPFVRQMWAPFAEDEVAHRIQQYLSLATLLREVGKLSLAGMKILDVGCGQGRMLRACLDMGASPQQLAGVDLRAKAIDEARRLSPQIDFQISNGSELQFADGEFDLVMQFVVFSSIFQDALRRQLASEMTRVVKPGGYIFWWDLNATVQKEHTEPLRPHELFPGMTHQTLLAASRPNPSYCLRLPRRLKTLVDKMGFPATHTAALIGPKR
jgi:2-polyprenyl-3-methyl-5-hydroxy-6-metoxy-1,4-benzoquinol methylase